MCHFGTTSFGSKKLVHRQLNLPLPPIWEQQNVTFLRQRFTHVLLPLSLKNEAVPIIQVNVADQYVQTIFSSYACQSAPFLCFAVVVFIERG